MLEPALYRVRVNSCPDWVAYATCTLGISVGQPYHEGDKFAATVEWLQHAEFPAVHAAYSRLAASDPALSASIAADIDGFNARQVKHGGGSANVSAVRTASRAYLIEELAVITLQGRSQNSARIYPGPELASFRAVRSGRVADAPAGLERDYYVHINLERRKLPAPRFRTPRG